MGSHLDAKTNSLKQIDSRLEVEKLALQWPSFLPATS